MFFRCTRMNPGVTITLTLPPSPKLGEGPGVGQVDPLTAFETMLKINLKT